MGKLAMGLSGRVHETTVRVLYGDTDAGGMVYNGTYLRYFEFGRGELMRTNGMSYKSLEALGFILPVAESYVRYKAPARYDDLLTIKTCIGQVTPFSCRFHCHIYQDKTLIAKGFTNHASIKRDGILTALPDEYFKKMQELSA
jgi:acyl-CoA thioester hydrolase